jgi:hypothetical protein
MTRTRLTENSLGTSKVAASRSTELKRDLDGAAPYDKDNLAHLVSLLTHVEAAFVGAKGALDNLSLIPMDQVSPDGKFGGRGFVMAVRDMKENLARMQVELSDIRDTLKDEFNNPGWGLSDGEKEELRNVEDKATQGTQESLDAIDQELADMGQGAEGEQPDGEQPVEGEQPVGETEEVPAEEDEFPSMDEIGAPSETPKMASLSSNNVFVGLRSTASPLAKKLASRVLGGLVKRASDKSLNLVGETK